MNNTGRMLLLLHTGRREDDWRRADDWRRLHTRPDALPMPTAEPSPRAGFARILRLISRHA